METYPRLATVIGFCRGEEKTLKAVYEVLTVQRDFGNRSDRKLARLKYTVDKYGVEWFKRQMEQRMGFELEPAQPYLFETRHDNLGWRQVDGLWHYTVLVENGRVADTPDLALKTALYEVAKTGLASFRFTSNQNVMLTEIADENKQVIDGVLERFGVRQFTENSSGIRKNAIACVALNTCPLALAEAQRYFPSLIGKIEKILSRHNLENEGIVMRMTGCPNGCGRPYAAEVGFVGTALGRYNLHIGGDREGTRLNTKYKESLNEDEILATLDQLFSEYAFNRKAGESFGDYTYFNILKSQSN